MSLIRSGRYGQNLVYVNIYTNILYVYVYTVNFLYLRNGLKQPYFIKCEYFLLLFGTSKTDKNNLPHERQHLSEKQKTQNSKTNILSEIYEVP